MAIQHQHGLSGNFTPSLFQAIESVAHPGITSPLCSRYHIVSGSALYRIGEPCTSIYKISTGFFKITGEKPNGHEQVLGFQIPDDIIGLEGIDEGQHNRNAIALQDSVVLQIPFFALETPDKNAMDLRHGIYALMCEEIMRQQNAILTMGSMDARARVAVFILHLSNRFKKVGYSQSEFNLFMNRADIASYLGLASETISRVLSQLEQDKIIAVDYRRLIILDRERLLSIGNSNHQ